MSLARCLLMLGLSPLGAAAQPSAVTIAGRGPETFVLVSGMVGGVAGFRRLEARLVGQGYRVIVIDPYRLSIDSADVTFAALARRVDRVLAERGIVGARVVAHAHGAGVMLRVAATDPRRVADLTLLDGAFASHRSATLSASIRLAPLLACLPGGRSLIRAKLVDGLRQNAGHQEWLDAGTQRAYTEPMLDNIGRVVAMAVRLSEARETESIERVVARIRVPVTVLLGAVSHQAAPDPADIAALAPLGNLLRIEWIPGVGHFPHEEALDVVMGALLAPRISQSR